MTQKAFLTAYKEFVSDAGLSDYSVAQYGSYLINACKKLPTITNHLELIATSDDDDQKALYAEEINIALTLALKDDTCPVSKKMLRNYKSATALLVAFLGGMNWEKNKGAIPLPTLNSASEYERKDLRKIFLSRLKTQDRLSYSYGVFAARVLCKIATRNKVKLFNKAVDNVKFLYAPNATSFFRLKNINKLIIATDGYAYIEKAGVTYPVYTEVFKNGKTAGFEKAKVSTSRHLSLDHDTPMVKALEEELKNMPEYKKLSDSIMLFKKTKPKAKASDLSKEYFKKEYSSAKFNETEILNEMSTFLDNMQLTIMHSSYNSSKNSN